MALDRRYRHSILSFNRNLDLFAIFGVCDLFIYISFNHQKGRKRLFKVEAYFIANSFNSNNGYHGHRFIYSICHINNLIYIHDILVHIIWNYTYFKKSR